jgi:hypothetical protein
VKGKEVKAKVSDKERAHEEQYLFELSSGIEGTWLPDYQIIIHKW